MAERRRKFGSTDIDELFIVVPNLRQLDRQATVTPPFNSSEFGQNNSDIMQRRFEKGREKEQALLEDVGDNNSVDDVPIQITARRHHTVDDPEHHHLKPSQPRQRRNRRRRSGSFTGGIWRRGHRNRTLVGYAIPPPNVHSTDWKDMLTITDATDTKFIEQVNNANAHQEKAAKEEAEKQKQKGASVPTVPTAASARTEARLATVPENTKKSTSTTPGGSGVEKIPTSATSSAVSGAPQPLFSQMKFSDSNMSLNRANWVSETFTRRECCKFVPTNRDVDKCGCGRSRSAHSFEALHELAPINRTTSVFEKDAVETSRRARRGLHERWSLRKHTSVHPTDAFGQIEFQGGPHPYKAQYVRMSFDTEPAYIMSLFEHVWQIAPPRLIITVHGGTANFDLQPKLARVFRKGLLKAAMTTGAWIITSGCDVGVVKHVAAALEVAGSAQRNKIVCIGISPWGLLKKREDLKGEDKTVAYYPFATKGRFTVLNNRHSYFLLVDNGTVGRYGAEVILRKRLECYISQKQKIFGGSRSVPVVCVVLEGGSCTIRSVLDYVTNIPRVPVVVCDGSGRAADLLAFAHQVVAEDGSLPDGVRPQLLSLVERIFSCGEGGADRILHELIVCAQQKNLLTIFRLGEKGEHDVDHAILTALLKGQNLAPSDQLALALAWNRVDIARSDIFSMGQEWPPSALHNAMMEALIHDRVDFVRLLLENGVNMQKFLTISRLEELYNTDKGPPNTLYYIVRDVVKIRPGYQYKLPHIGMVIEKLMGNAYQSLYTSSEFRQRYQSCMKKYKAFRQKFMRSTMANTSRSRGNSAVLSRQSTEPGGLFGIANTSMMLNGGNANGNGNGMCAAGASGVGLSGLNTNAADMTMSEPMAVSAMSGSRALSNHILWRSAFRRDYPINPMQMRPPNLADSRECCSEFEEELSMTGGSESSHNEYQFRYPFSELLLWAVLTKRQEMALCMWQHGEEALAKALVACRLYKSLATEAAEDYLEVEICDELKKYAEFNPLDLSGMFEFREFRQLSLELLDHCYHQDDAQTLQLLTYQLSNWSSETCLALAVMVNNKDFLAHPCCQILLADLWHGGLRIRSHSNVKVIAGLLLPPSIVMLEFKTREELLAQPQTAAEHEQGLNYHSSSSSAHSSSSSDDSTSSSSSSDEDDEKKSDLQRRTRKHSHGSVQSLNIASLFHSRRRKKKSERETDASANETGRVAAHPYHNSSDYGTFGAGSPPPSYVRKRTRNVSVKLNGSLKAHEESKKSAGSSIYGSDSIIGRSARKSMAMVTSLISEEQFPRPGVFPGFQRTRQIRFRRRLYEFYAAPITTFWAWALSFALFIAALTYVLLVKTPRDPTILEWILLAYVVAFGMEHVRKMMMSDMKPFLEKLKYFFFNYWNSVTMAAIVFYIIGFILRANGDPANGRVILACDSVLWTMKLLDYMSVHPRLGPYITMAGKMILNMSYIIVMLIVSLLSFGLARQSITYPNESWHWLLVRNIFMKPYFMLYGEVYADEIDVCGDEAWDTHLETGAPIMMRDPMNISSIGNSCVPGYWIPPILMTFFLLIANILLMSMLIAIFNHIFDATDEIAQQIWLFQRYRQVMEYESTPFLPPPFTPIYHTYMMIKYLHWKLTSDGKEEHFYSKRALFDFSLKLFLNADQVEKLHDFEEDCMEDLARQKEHEKNTSSDQRIFRTDQRTDQILNRLVDLQGKETMTREAVGEFDTRLAAIEKNQAEILEFVRQIAAFNAAQMTRPVVAPLTAVTSVSTAVTRASPSPDPDRVFETESAASQLNLTEERPPVTPGIRRQRTYTVSVIPGEDGTLLSPQPRDQPDQQQRLLSVASMDPLPQCKLSIRRQRHEEYTSITDSIAFGLMEQRFRLGRSNSSDRGESAASDAELETAVTATSSLTSTAIIEAAVSVKKRGSIFKSTKEDVEQTKEEERHADCELTDVPSEEELEEEEEDIDDDGGNEIDDVREAFPGRVSFQLVNELSVEALIHPPPTSSTSDTSLQKATSSMSTASTVLQGEHAELKEAVSNESLDTVKSLDLQAVSKSASV